MTKPPKCHRCGAKGFTTEIYVCLRLNADLCKDCYNSWYELRDKTIEALFENYVRSENTPKGFGTKPKK